MKKQKAALVIYGNMFVDELQINVNGGGGKPRIIMCEPQ